MEILTNRRKHFRNSIDTADKEIKEFLDNKDIPEILRREVLSEWEKECQKDINRLQDIWKKKIEGTKKAFEKDKAFIQRKTNSNENEINEENNVSNMERNSNIINEERRDTPNPSRHNSYNYNHYRSRDQSNHYNSKNYYRKHYPPRQRQHLSLRF